MRVGVDMDVIVPKGEKRKAERRKEDNERGQADKNTPCPQGDFGTVSLFGHSSYVPQIHPQIHPALQNTLFIAAERGI